VWPFRAKKTLGRRGEELAARTLKRKGMKILAANYRCPAGEVDLIALDPSTRRDGRAETIVFVEVKTRSSAQYASPESAVNRRKQRHIRKAAHYYLSRHETEGYNVRYDIVAIVAGKNAAPEIRHIVNAF